MFLYKKAYKKNYPSEEIISFYFRKSIWEPWILVHVMQINFFRLHCSFWIFVLSVLSGGVPTDLFLKKHHMWRIWSTPRGRCSGAPSWLDPYSWSPAGTGNSSVLPRTVWNTRTRGPMNLGLVLTVPLKHR